MEHKEAFAHPGNEYNRFPNPFQYHLDQYPGEEIKNYIRRLQHITVDAIASNRGWAVSVPELKEKNIKLSERNITLLGALMKCVERLKEYENQPSKLVTDCEILIKIEGE